VGGVNVQWWKDKQRHIHSPRKKNTPTLTVLTLQDSHSSLFNSSSLLTHLLKNTRTKQVGLGHMFRALCDADAAGELQEWLVSETSLEDVFVTIVISGDGVRRTAD
jgi:hypothetical protein